MNTYSAKRFSRIAGWGTLCAAALSCAGFPLHAAEADICTNVSGEQLRRCIEAASREAPAPKAASVNAPPPAGLRPAKPGAIPPTLPDPKRARDCTKMLKPDQLLCVARNEALNACRDPRKTPDYNRCTGDILARAPDPGVANCKEVAKNRLAFCQQRNKVFQKCKRDRMDYFTCLESETAGK